MATHCPVTALLGSGRADSSPTPHIFRCGLGQERRGRVLILLLASEPIRTSNVSLENSQIVRQPFEERCVSKSVPLWCCVSVMSVFPHQLDVRTEWAVRAEPGHGGQEQEPGHAVPADLSSPKQVCRRPLWARQCIPKPYHTSRHSPQPPADVGETPYLMP